MRLTESPYNQFPNALSPDGAYLVFRQDSTSSDLMLLDMKARQVQPLVQTTFMELNADFSQDGQLIAYQSNESGEHEIYVQSFREPGRRWKVSTGGGTHPKWASNGQELFYVALKGTLMRVLIQRRGEAVTIGAAEAVFDGVGYMASGRTYDVSPDGSRFLLMKPIVRSATSVRSIEVVLNWLEELKQRVPTH
jgi:serine/threonine-protein kinase